MIEAVLTSALTKEGLSAAIKEAILPDFLKSAENSIVKSFDKADLPLGELKEKVSEEVKEVEPKKGGRFRDVRNENKGGEVHHMPAASASDLPYDDGPAIYMDTNDHRQTASCGSSREAKEYQAKQKELIEKGNFKEAMQMDIDDIREKFGNKYDDAISQMLEYVETIKK